MEPSLEKLSAAVLVLLLVMAAEMGLHVEAGECLTRSNTFRGPCFNSDRCAATCMKEGTGYSGGKCRGLYLRCFCITPCAMPAPATAPDGDLQSSDAGFHE